MLFQNNQGMRLHYPIIDLHTHLRSNIPKHTKIAQKNGVGLVVYMANSDPPLDNLARIKKSLRKKRYCSALPVSAITKNLAGRELVDIEQIKPYVVGFSDDGQYLADLKLLQEILKKNVLVLAHCSPDYVQACKNPHLETEYIKRYLRVLAKTRGKLHIQHVSKKESVALIRKAKKQGLRFTCETCPHYFTSTAQTLKVKVNPPLGTQQDVEAIKQGLADHTIDVIASDYAPPPRKTGIANFKSFLPLTYRLVQEGTLNKTQLKEKLFLNPRRIIAQGGARIKKMVQA